MPHLVGEKGERGCWSGLRTLTAVRPGLQCRRRCGDTVRAYVSLLQRAGGLQRQARRGGHAAGEYIIRAVMLAVHAALSASRYTALAMHMTCSCMLHPNRAEVVGQAGVQRSMQALPAATRSAGAPTDLVRSLVGEDVKAEVLGPSGTTTASGTNLAREHDKEHGTCTLALAPIAADAGGAAACMVAVCGLGLVAGCIPAVHGSAKGFRDPSRI